MDLSIKINIALCVLSLLLAVISVITVVITVIQNHRMIEASTRPYISIYDAVTNFQSTNYYIILKNCGNSSATITSFETNYDLLNYVETSSRPRRPFEHIVGTTIVPGKSVTCLVSLKKLLNDTNLLEFKISYKSPAGKFYSEQINLNLQALTDSLIKRASTKDSELKIISFTLQDLVEKQL